MIDFSFSKCYDVHGQNHPMFNIQNQSGWLKHFYHQIWSWRIQSHIKLKIVDKYLVEALGRDSNSCCEYLKLMVLRSWITSMFILYPVSHFGAVFLRKMPSWYKINTSRATDTFLVFSLKKGPIFCEYF